MPCAPGPTPLDSRGSGSGCLTDTDWIVSTRPHFFACIPGSTPRTRRTTDSSESSKACCHCSSLISSKKPRAGPPALATRMSTPPHCDDTRCVNACTSSFLVTSAGMASTSALVAARTSSAAVLRSLSVRAHIATFAPSRANSSAHALPMPLLAAVTSATLPRSPRSMGSPLYMAGRLDLLEEFRAVARRDLQAAQPVVAHYLERELLAGAVPPQREIELLAARHLLGVERYDDVALLQPTTVARPLGHDPGDDHALLDRVREDAEPGALGPAHHAAVTQHLARVLAIVVDGNRERAAHDLVEVQRDDPEDRAGHREETAAPEPGIRRAAHDPAIEQVLPVRLELAEIGHDDAAAHALVAEDARGRVRLRDERVQVHHGAEQVACELDRDVHQGRPPRWRAKNSPTRRCASALAEASKPTVAPQQRPPAALWFSTSARNTRGCPSTSK